MVPQFFARNGYRAAMSLHKYEWLRSTITFHDHSTVSADFLDDRFACMKWFLTEFENNARKCYRHTEFVRNFYASYSCDSKVYLIGQKNVRQNFRRTKFSSPIKNFVNFFRRNTLSDKNFVQC